MKNSIWQAMAAAVLAVASFSMMGGGAAPALAAEVAASRVEAEISAGVKDGSLTRSELQALLNAKRRVAIMIRLIGADAKVTPWERQQINALQARLLRAVRARRINTEFRVATKHIALRLARGVSEGAITGNQAAEFRKAQKRVLAMIVDAKADGIITARERVAAVRAQRALGRRINRLRRIAPYRRALGTKVLARRIEAGLREGRILPGEARSLRAANYRVGMLRRSAEADGRVTERERAALNEARSQPILIAERRGVGVAAGVGSRSAGRSAARRYMRAQAGFGRALSGGMRRVGRLLGGR